MIMEKKYFTSRVEGCKYDTLNLTSIPIYDWMLETNLHQADLLVYAALFDELKDEPLMPQQINLSDIARRIHYSSSSVYGAVDLLVNLKLIFTQGDSRNKLFSLYPFDTLDLK